MRPSYNIRFQRQNSSTIIRYHQYLVAAAITDKLGAILEERKQAEKEIRELTKRIARDFEHSTVLSRP